jgi:hypothetical protein
MTRAVAFNYSHQHIKEKELSGKVAIYTNELSNLMKMPLGSPADYSEISSSFIWITYLRLLMDAQSRNMLKLLHQRMGYLHFFEKCF